MRLVRLVVAGVAVGAVGGYVGALLRPRAVHRNLAADGLMEGMLDPVPLPERGDEPVSPELATVPATAEARR
jgi:hypothetical protein